MLKINEDFIRNIIENKIRESETLEFKQFIFKDSKFSSIGSANINKLLKEICAFANSNGGLILLGIGEDENHNPTNLIDTEITNEKIETWEQSFRNTIATKTIPAIYGIKLKHFEIDNKNILAISIPKSVLKPHAYDDGEHKFTIRNGNESRPMRYLDLKRSFSELDITQKKIIQFRDARLSSILDNEIDEVLTTEPALVLHIIPEWALDETQFLDLKKCEYNENLEIFNPPSYRGIPSYNANGLIKTRHNYKENLSSYIQIFTNGMLEVGEIYLMKYDADNNENQIYHWDNLEKILAKKIFSYCMELANLNLGYSFYICFSMINVKNCYSRASYYGEYSDPIKQNIVKSPIVKWSIDDSFTKSLFPLFTTFAHIFSSRSSSLYSSDTNEPLDEKFKFLGNDDIEK